MKLKISYFFTVVPLFLFSVVNGFRLHGSFHLSFRNKPVELKSLLQVSSLQQPITSFLSYKVFPNALGTTSTVLFADSSAVGVAGFAATPLSPSSSPSLEKNTFAFNREDYQLASHYFRAGKQIGYALDNDAFFITFRELLLSAFNPNSTDEFIHVRDLQSFKELFSEQLSSVVDVPFAANIRNIPGQINRLIFVYDRIYQKISQQIQIFASRSSSEMKEKLEESRKALNDWKSVLCEEIDVPAERLFEQRQEAKMGENNKHSSNITNSKNINTITTPSSSDSSNVNSPVRMKKKLVLNTEFQKLLFRYFGYDHTTVSFQLKMSQIIFTGDIIEYFFKLFSVSVSRLDYLNRNVVQTGETMEMRRATANNILFARIIS
jgi:hypothetical protein